MTAHPVQNLCSALCLALGLALALVGCNQPPSTGARDDAVSPLSDNPFPSTYKPGGAPDTLIRGATIYDGTGKRLDNASVLLRAGKIAAVGSDVDAPDGAVIIEAGGRFITPGIVDPHSHLGNAYVPLVADEFVVWDVNEASGPFNAAMWAETGMRTQDPAFGRARAAGVTTLQILPGSANLFGGRGVVVKNFNANTVQDMKYPDAPYGLKMACGENAKRTYGEDGHFPTSRMGVVAGQREAFARAREAIKAGKRFDADDPETTVLMAMMRGDLKLHIHCYTSDDMALLLDIAREFEFKITAFHHAAEAYKIADRLAAAGVCAIVWSDWWGFKMEIFDAVRANAAILEAAGACVTLHSDSPIIGQRLTIEAAKAMAFGRRAGLDIPPERAIKWITSNPARVLGLDADIGTVEPGKHADLVVWSGDPFSVYTRADLVYLDGALIHDRARPAADLVSDIELGQPVLEARP